MVAYNFKKEFVSKIESGEKTQTIRRYGKRKHAEPGGTIQLYTAMRTKSCRKIRQDAICSHRMSISIDVDELIIDGKLYTPANREQFARNDGFRDYAEMCLFFENQIQELPFFGALIMWKN